MVRSIYPIHCITSSQELCVIFAMTVGIQKLISFNDAGFCSSIDAEMKHLQSACLGYNKKQAVPLTLMEEEVLWEKNSLGDHNPKNTIMFNNGLHFALYGGEQLSQLRHDPCQIELVEKHR